MLSSNPNFHTSGGAGLAPEQVARALYHSYTLFGQLYSTGITRGNLRLVQALPELIGHLPEPSGLDEAAAAHYHLFGFNVFPYESIFLDDTGLLGGRVTESTVRSYHRFAFQSTAKGHSPDHFGQELEAMAFLCLAEANALVSGPRGTIVSIRRRQITFLQEHLLRWLCPFVLAVKAQNVPFFAAVAELTITFIYGHYHSLLAENERSAKAWSLPTPPDLLADDRTGLRQIAAFFATPAYSGVFLSRDEVGRMARALDLPRGFGDRQTLLTNLMRTAVQYDQFAFVVKALEAVVKDWQTAYQRQIGKMPLLDSFALPWHERAGRTINLIAHLQAKIGTEQ